MMITEIKIIVLLLVTFVHSSFINSSSLLTNRIASNLGITKLGPCSAKLDDGSIIDLSKKKRIENEILEDNS